MRKYVIAVDEGTTGARAIAFDRSGRMACMAYHEFPQHFPKPGWVEHDPLEISASVDRALQEVFAKLPKDSVDSIGITNQRETVILWDRKTGRPACNAIVWQCRRTAARCEALAKTAKAKVIRKKTGLPCDPYFSASKIEWQFKHSPAVRKLARQGRLAFGTPDTWVLWNLTGGKAHCTDYTNASRTMLFDINKKRWDAELLKLFGVPADILPEVRKSSSVFGHTVKNGNIPAGIPISAIAGDQQAALYGQTCFEPGSIKNTYGTGAFALLNAGAKRPADGKLITTLGCDGGGNPVYVLEGSVFIAGAGVQWLRDGLKILETSPESERIATSVKDNGGVYFVPALSGLGAPFWDADARGAFFGLTRGTARAHLVRAVLESMCYSTRAVLEEMAKASGLKLRSLRVDGGAAKNNFICSFQSGISGLEILRPEAAELTALGAAYLAGLCTGFWRSADEIKKLPIKNKIFKPPFSKKIADGFYAGWRDAVSRTLTK